MTPAALLVASITQAQPALPPVEAAHLTAPAPLYATALAADAPVVLVGKGGGGGKGGHRGGSHRGGFGKSSGFGSKSFGSRRGGPASDNTESFSRSFPFFESSDPRSESVPNRRSDKNFFERLFDL